MFILANTIDYAQCGMKLLEYVRGNELNEYFLVGNVRLGWAIVGRIRRRILNAFLLQPPDGEDDMVCIKNNF